MTTTKFGKVCVQVTEPGNILGMPAEVTVDTHQIYIGNAAELETRIADLQRALEFAKSEARRVGAEF